jgi:pyroglutamyl-peptidase
VTTVLLTAFEPFGPRPGNSSLAALERVAAEPPEGVALATGVLPVTFDGAWPALRECVAETAPDAVLLLGQAARRGRVEVERVALNVADTDEPDNAGSCPRDEPVDPDGPVGLLATIPVRAIVDALRADGVPAAVSSSAGTYVCNATLYAALRHLDVPAGFIHLPCTPEQVVGEDVPSMDAAVSARAVRTALAVISR